MLHVACAANEAYLPDCATMMRSLLTHSDPASIQLHFLHGSELSRPALDALQRAVAGWGGRLRLHSIPEGIAEELPRPWYMARETWFRVLLPDLLQDVDRVLYLDSDTLVVDSLDALAAVDLDSHYVAAVSDVPAQDSGAVESGVRSEDYFNAGVLLMNLAQMRAHGCTQALQAYATTHEIQWADQDALNAVLGSRRYPLHPRWNCMNSLYLYPDAEKVFGRETVREACRNPAIVHFEGSHVVKPWYYLSKHPFQHVYLEHRAETPWPLPVPEGKTLRNRVLRLLPWRVIIALLNPNSNIRKTLARVGVGRR